MDHESSTSSDIFYDAYSSQSPRVGRSRASRQLTGSVEVAMEQLQQELDEIKELLRSRESSNRDSDPATVIKPAKSNDTLEAAAGQAFDNPSQTLSTLDSSFGQKRRTTRYSYVLAIDTSRSNDGMVNSSLKAAIVLDKRDTDNDIREASPSQLTVATAFNAEQQPHRVPSVPLTHSDKEDDNVPIMTESPRPVDELPGLLPRSSNPSNTACLGAVHDKDDDDNSPIGRTLGLLSPTSYKVGTDISAFDQIEVVPTKTESTSHRERGRMVERQTPITQTVRSGVRSPTTANSIRPPNVQQRGRTKSNGSDTAVEAPAKLPHQRSNSPEKSPKSTVRSRARSKSRTRDPLLPTQPAPFKPLIDLQATQETPQFKTSAPTVTRPQPQDIKTFTARIYINDSRKHQVVELTSLMTVGAVIQQLRQQNYLSDDSAWTLFEMANDYHIERPLKDWEVVTDILLSWADPQRNALLVKKYMFRNSLLYDANVSETEKILEGWLHVEVKKGKWQKRWVFVRDNIVYFAKDKKSNNETALCHLTTFDVFTPTQSFRKAPTSHQFVLKSLDNPKIFENPDDDYIYYLCCEANDTLKHWVLRLRILKTLIQFNRHPERVLSPLSPISASFAVSQEPLITVNNDNAIASALPKRTDEELRQYAENMKRNVDPIPRPVIRNLIFYLNGTRVKLHNPDPSLTLLQYIRSTGLTGTKLGCAEGGCGACTVLVSSFNHNTQRIHHTSVNACLAPLVSMANRHVITTEGIGNANNPHPVQERIALSHGSQCGFCTPGIVMALYALLRNHPRPTVKEIEEGFDGNLCRCTGYRPILDAARTFAVDVCCGGKANGKGEGTTNGNGVAKPPAKLNGCSMGTACCKNTPNLSNSKEASTAYEFPKVDFKKYDPSQELIFPPKLIKTPLVPLAFESETKKWFRPTTLGELFALKSQYPNAKLVAGNSEIGIEVKFKRLVYPVNIYVSDIPDLRSVEWLDNGLRVGANLTINGFQNVLEEAVKSMPKHKTEAFRAFLENIRWFAGNQIRNVATLAGNIATASPISDLNPVFVASNAVLTVVHPDDGAREIPMTDFFLGYRQTRLTAPDVICNIFIPFSRQGEYIRAYKQAKRRDDDIAIANAGLRVVIDSDTRKVTDATFAYGGLGPTTIQAKVAVKNLIGQTWGDSAVFDRMVTDLPVDLPLSFGSPGGMPAFRKALSGSFLYKFWNDVGLKIGLAEKDGIDPQAVVNIERGPSTSWRSFEHLNPQSVVGQPIPHLSAIKQVTGEALYTDDIPRVHNEVYAALVMSQKPRAKILSVDASEALEVDGVIDYVSLKDLPGNNIWGGGPTKDEQLFADGEVFCVGQTIGLILAENQMIAQHAARLVKVEYEVLPHILTIQEAIAAKSFYPPRPSIQRGDTAKGFAESYKIFEGDVHIGGQEQFYLETQASLVVPKGEDDEMDIFSSTQNATETQLVVASALGVPSNRIYCRVKRLGGGFGGKETRSIPLAATLAVAAKKLRRPVRCMLDRDEDMITSGQRHPFYAKYKVGVSKEGKVLAYELDIYNNAGWTADLSQAVLERSLSHCDNCYYVPNVHVRGYMCKTNIHSNTAFRGFGGPQGMFVAETWVEEVADGMAIPVEKFREMNLYKEGQLTHFNQELTDWNLPPLYYEVKKSSEYDRRRKEIDEFNSKSKWLKRGLSIIPTKFGISFTALHMNQAGALVHIYEDGSILLSHGGVEMGQGLHTKMVQ
ncbi:hypothetical protein BZG36_01218 [Bifiguratus adelaidae]|uniref:xanthine dehydrogenase n=1 Tax=Bifiguratus adelaidae TaxID=1938954 RepID=A0A261Y5U3_9FUNG|nr:hypothetical protein BZG36_01218 [Bifiguratus adelaidae]